MFGQFLDYMHFLHRIDDGHWIRWPIGGITTSWITGMWAQVDGTHAVNLIALGILGVGSSCLGLWRLYEVQSIKIKEARALSEIAIAEARRSSLTRVPDIIVTQAMPPMDPKGPPK